MKLVMKLKSPQNSIVDLSILVYYVVFQ